MITFFKRKKKKKKESYDSVADTMEGQYSIQRQNRTQWTFTCRTQAHRGVRFAVACLRHYAATE